MEQVASVGRYVMNVLSIVCSVSIVIQALIVFGHFYNFASVVSMIVLVAIAILMVVVEIKDIDIIKREAHFYFVPFSRGIWLILCSAIPYDGSGFSKFNTGFGSAVGVVYIGLQFFPVVQIQSIASTEDEYEAINENSTLYV